MGKDILGGDGKIEGEHRVDGVAIRPPGETAGWDEAVVVTPLPVVADLYTRIPPIGGLHKHDKFRGG